MSPKITDLGDALPVDRLSSSKEAKIRKEMRRIGKDAETDMQARYRQMQEADREFDRAEREYATAQRSINERIAGQALSRGYEAREYAILSERDRKILAGIFMRDAKSRSDARHEQMMRLMKLEALAWVEAVGMLVSNANVTSAKEFGQILAQAHHTLNQQLYTASKLQVHQYNAEWERLQLYAAMLEKLRRYQFLLFVNDGQVLPPAIANKQVLRNFYEVLKDTCQEEIYEALIETINQCTQGLNQDAWPLAYTQLMKSIVRSMGEPGGEPGFKFEGGSLATWRIVVDFEDLFGNYTDLQTGFHFGTMRKDKRRQRLPYTGNEDDFVEPDERVRYRFWKAVWEGKTEFYGRYGSREKAVAGREKAIDYRIGQNVKEKKQLQKDIGRINRRARQSGSLFQSPRATAELEAKKRRMKELPRERADLFHQGINVERDTKGLPISPSAKEDTINARVRWWSSRRIAPFWLYLEFGQLQFPPTIPPKGFTYRFFLNARRRIDQRVKLLFQKYLEETGVRFNKAGNPIYTGIPVAYGPMGGTTPRKGRQLGEAEYQKFLRGIAERELIIKRSAQEAVDFGRRMGALIPPLRAAPEFGKLPKTGFGVEPTIVDDISDSRRKWRWNPAGYPEAVTPKMLRPKKPNTAPNFYTPPRPKYGDFRNFGERMRDLKKLRQNAWDRKEAKRKHWTYEGYKRWASTHRSQVRPIGKDYTYKQLDAIRRERRNQRRQQNYQLRRFRETGEWPKIRKNFYLTDIDRLRRRQRRRNT